MSGWRSPKMWSLLMEDEVLPGVTRPVWSEVLQEFLAALGSLTIWGTRQVEAQS